MRESHGETCAMLALAKVAAGVGGVALIERPTPQAGPGQVVIDVAAAGICGTDMQIYRWAPRMARRMALPRVLGHEVCGHIVAVGDGVDVSRIGQRVALESHIYCGNCRLCLTERAHLCHHLQYPGIDIDGAFAGQIAVPEQIARVIPDDISDNIAAMLEPFGIAVHASAVGRGVDGRSVLVNGCGPIGLMNVAAARALGASTIIACDLNPRRLEMARTFGADTTINPAEEDVVQHVDELSEGTGIDVVCEYTASASGFETALATLSKGGELKFVAAPSQPHETDFTRWVSSGINVLCIHGRRLFEDWELALELVRSRRVDLEPLVSHVLPLSRATEGFDLIIDGEALKPIIVPDAKA